MVDSTPAFIILVFFFFFSSRRRHTRLQGDWSSDVCSSDLEAGDEPRDVRRPQTLLGLAMATRKRQIDLGPREPLEDGDGGAIRPVGGDLRLLGLQHAQHRRVAGPEAEAVIEVEGPRAERLRALVAELVAVHDDRSHAEDPPVRPEELGREERRLTLAERREDVDDEVERAEEPPAPAVP